MDDELEEYVFAPRFGKFPSLFTSLICNPVIELDVDGVQLKVQTFRLKEQISAWPTPSTPLSIFLYHQPQYITCKPHSSIL